VGVALSFLVVLEGLRQAALEMTPKSRAAGHFRVLEFYVGFVVGAYSLVWVFDGRLVEMIPDGVLIVFVPVVGAFFLLSFGYYIARAIVVPEQPQYENYSLTNH
jgi:hypothetical protein